ncbi:Spy/CpxP family protein refolding chaperone [Shivajiella indica]|uniref:TonB-dependent receptor plug domain-containing protein n=1 Tax=Shivajiella indica TaxID=872115 RepID=A0ABW5B1V1_9BACT
MKKLLTICLFLVLAQSYAQDIFKETLYSADLVMTNRESINLTDLQAERIKNIHSQNASDFRTLKWELDGANAKLKSILSAEKVDQSVANRQMDLVLSLENQLKKKQLNTMIAIKNELTESQKAELNILKYTPTSFTNFSEAIPGSSSDSDKGSKNIMSVVSSGNNQPIYIIKQGLKEKKVSNIDVNAVGPNMVNSITVLKGNSAWEMYGEEGKNGVVILELKKEANYKFE